MAMTASTAPSTVSTASPSVRRAVTQVGGSTGRGPQSAADCGGGRGLRKLGVEFTRAEYVGELSAAVVVNAVDDDDGVAAADAGGRVGSDLEGSLVGVGGAGGGNG